jgi:putative addiction module component (TIGR02574 family)
MPKPLPDPPPGFDELPIEDQLDYVQSLWDRIAADPKEVPVPEWHLKKLAERLEAYRADPGENAEWGEVCYRLQGDLEDQSES